MKSNNNANSIKPFISPLRYPGSKRRLTGYIEQTLRLNNLKPSLYVEPFAGGASIALYLMQKELVENVILIDRDPLIAGFWEAVFFDTDWLIDQILTVDISIENWHKFKKLNPRTSRENALTCLFLNRTSFSGILRAEVGPLGGRDQNSDYKIDCRFPRSTLAERVRQIAVKRDMVFSVWNCSWEDGIKKIRGKQSKGKLPDQHLFFYLDPPFFEEANTLYRYFFEYKDHVCLRNFVVELKDKWLLSYDSVENVEALYGDHIKIGSNGTTLQQIELIYSLPIISRKRSKEVIISNLEKLAWPSEDSGKALGDD